MSTIHTPGPRLVVFISGSGSNLQAIKNAIAQGSLQAHIILVVSNRKTAYGLQRASNAGIETRYVPLKPYTRQGLGREQYDADMATMVSLYHPDLIVLAGWMHIFSPAFLNHFPNSVINLHPALPGNFPGTDAIARAFEAYQRGEITQSGCMVHYAVPEVDAGPVIGQSMVPFEPGDTLESFATRMHEHEHRLIVEATRKALSNVHL